MTDRATQSRRTIPLHIRGWWYFLRCFCWIWFKLCYRYRFTGRQNIPRQGAVLYVSNHQSYLDPIIVGLATNQPFFAMARKTLFRGRFFAWLLRSLSAIPVDQESAGDKGAIKACIEVLNRGERLLIFPEGSRTEDGDTQDFAPGIMLLIRRARPQVIPVAIEGAFEVWPRGSKLRWSGRVRCHLGPPIAPEDLLAVDTAEALEMLRNRVDALRPPGKQWEIRMTKIE
ncbi:MAG: 1-acyl-sn-glycerol-3-phosphate acyltransferase [Phycisphaeraceae bacterium]|nr:1-acyl-sn-glycerol-3-phosphate acyltransferase [Phycisphaeraceae bacterium]